MKIFIQSVAFSLILIAHSLFGAVEPKQITLLAAHNKTAFTIDRDVAQLSETLKHMLSESIFTGEAIQVVLNAAMLSKIVFLMNEAHRILKQNLPHEQVVAFLSEKVKTIVPRTIFDLQRREQWDHADKQVLNFTQDLFRAIEFLDIPALVEPAADATTKLMEHMALTEVKQIDKFFQTITVKDPAYLEKLREYFHKNNPVVVTAIPPVPPS